MGSGTGSVKCAIMQKAYRSEAEIATNNFRDEYHLQFPYTREDGACVLSDRSTSSLLGAGSNDEE